MNKNLCAQNKYYKQSESFANLFTKSLNKQDIGIGEVVLAEVIYINHKFVVLNSDLKSYSYVSIDEFLDKNGKLNIKIGDVLSVYVDYFENGNGDTILSREKAKRLSSWIFLEKALNDKMLVTGDVICKVKGGMTVMVNGIKSFLPGSLIDIRPTKDSEEYEGKKLDFIIIKLDRKRNNVVLSRKAVIELIQKKEKLKLLKTLREGMIVNGVIKNITDYGVFIDLGGVDGLLHITDIAWRRIRHPSEVLSMGQSLDTKILKFDKDSNRVSLGIKQLEKNPWLGISDRYPSGTKLLGKVSNITDYGIFVEIESGIEGLVHLSEMFWEKKNITPLKMIKLSDEIEVMILSIDEERRRISLGMKQCTSNPWEIFNNKYKKGDRIFGIVKSVTDFGIFVGLKYNVDGLIHLSDLSWSEHGKNSLRKYKKGDEIELLILNIDVKKERISLGIKQLSYNPFNNFILKKKRGSVVSGTIKFIDHKGAIISLTASVNAYLKIPENLSKRNINYINSLKIGHKISGVIDKIDKKFKNIELMMKFRSEKK